MHGNGGRNRQARDIHEFVPAIRKACRISFDILTYAS